jgi:hypothetical protein
VNGHPEDREIGLVADGIRTAAYDDTMAHLEACSKCRARLAPGAPHTGGIAGRLASEQLMTPLERIAASVGLDDVRLRTILPTRSVALWGSVAAVLGTVALITASLAADSGSLPYVSAHPGLLVLTVGPAAGPLVVWLAARGPTGLQWAVGRATPNDNTTVLLWRSGAVSLAVVVLTLVVWAVYPAAVGSSARAAAVTGALTLAAGVLCALLGSSRPAAASAGTWVVAACLSTLPSMPELPVEAVAVSVLLVASLLTLAPRTAGGLSWRN